MLAEAKRSLEELAKSMTFLDRESWTSFFGDFLSHAPSPVFGLVFQVRIDDVKWLINLQLALLQIMAESENIREKLTPVLRVAILQAKLSSSTSTVGSIISMNCNLVSLLLSIIM